MVDWFSLPIGANPANDQRVGVDELGNPTYRTVRGQQYTTRQTYRPQRETEPGSFGRMRESVGNLVRGATDAFVSGVTAPARAARGEPVTYGDAFETAGMAQLGGAAMPAPRGAIRSGALRAADDVAETPAQTVARMLREGNAADVTDDLMAQADPQEMFRLYESGLTGADMPMDEASRMARAQGMGFDTDAYHSTGADFPAVDNGTLIGGQFWSTDDITSINAGEVGAAGRSSVMPLRVRQSNPAGWRQYDQFGVDEMIGRGYDGMRLPESDGTNTFVTFDPNQVRSRFARFDPRLSHLANLNAANASPVTGLMSATAVSEQDQIQRLAEYLAEVGGL